MRCSTPNAHSSFYIGSAVVLGLHLTFNKCGLANELSNKPAIGSRIDILRRADLQQAALVENRQPIGDRQGFLLIMGHIDSGQSRLFANAPDLRAHFQPQLGIEIR